MIIETSNAQFAGGALDPDQSATIFDSAALSADPSVYGFPPNVEVALMLPT
jgi:hypothetical protein